MGCTALPVISPLENHTRLIALIVFSLFTSLIILESIMLHSVTTRFNRLSEVLIQKISLNILGIILNQLQIQRLLPGLYSVKYWKNHDLN